MIKATATKTQSQASDTVYSEINVEADIAGIMKLANFLLRLDDEQADLFDVEQTLPAGTTALTGVLMIVNEKKLACKKNGLCLEISGDANSLTWFAQYVAELAADPGFGHVHIEYYEGHPHLDSSHTSIVLSEI